MNPTWVMIRSRHERRTMWKPHWRSQVAISRWNWSSGRRERRPNGPDPAGREVFQISMKFSRSEILSVNINPLSATQNFSYRPLNFFVAPRIWCRQPPP